MSSERPAIISTFPKQKHNSAAPCHFGQALVHRPLSQKPHDAPTTDFNMIQADLIAPLHTTCVRSPGHLVKACEQHLRRTHKYARSRQWNQDEGRGEPRLAEEGWHTSSAGQTFSISRQLRRPICRAISSPLDYQATMLLWYLSGRTTLFAKTA